MGGKNGGNITLDAVDDINTSGIGSTMLLTSFDANSGNLHIESEGRVNTNEAPLVTASGTGRGGNIYIYGREDVTTGNINARSFARQGGEIYIDSSNSIRANDKIETNRNDITFNSSVELNDNVEISIRGSGNIRFNETVDGQHDLNLNTGTGTVYFNDEVGLSAPLNNLNIRGEVSSSDTPIEIATVNNITTGNITSSNGIALTSQNGRITAENLDTSAVDDAGNVTLQANNISVATINAQSENGTGGNVTVTTPQFFQATDTFSDRNGQNASISVAGAVEGGEVKIYHGGNGQTPFIVGDATVNGTAGEITRGNDTPEQSIETYQEYPYTHKQDSDRLQIVSVPQPQIPIQPEPTPAPHPVAPSPETPEPLEELDRGKNPLEDLAFLIGDILNAKTTISTDETGDYAFEWQTTNPNTGEQVLLSLNADNPYPEETASPPEIANISAPVFSSLNTFSALNFKTNPEQLIGDIDQLLEAEYETYFGENLTDEEVTAQSIRETLKTIELETGTRAVVIYALPLPDALQLILVRPDAPPLVRRVPEADPRTLKQTVALFRHRIANKTSRHYLNSAQKLHAWLVAPLEDELDRLEIDTLVFSLGGMLRSLPLAALHNGQQFLIERYSLGTIPSMSLTDTRYASIKNAEVLGMGASEFPNTPYEPLPAVPVELATVTASLASGESFLNEEFTLDNLKTQRDRGNFQIVHLATHASFQPRSPENAHIQFWNEKIGLDGLRKARWYDRSTVELLVLSACETAVGDRRVELGFGGLAVQAGVKSTVASLWKVSDMGTSVLMGELYRALANPDIPIKAEALRQAQLRMLYGEVEPPSEFGELSVDFSHPYYWTGFSLIGSPW